MLQQIIALFAKDIGQAAGKTSEPFSHLHITGQQTIDVGKRHQSLLQPIGNRDEQTFSVGCELPLCGPASGSKYVLVGFSSLEEFTRNRFLKIIIRPQLDFDSLRLTTAMLFQVLYQRQEVLKLLSADRALPPK